VPAALSEVLSQRGAFRVYIWRIARWAEVQISSAIVWFEGFGNAIMSTDVVRELWRSRAANRAVFQPTASVGARSEGWVLLPRVGGSLSNVDVGIFGNDVPASGNCLYHAVWSSAVLAGVQHPFGAVASDHVFGVRVKVAIEVVRLLDEGRVRSGGDAESISRVFRGDSAYRDGASAWEANRRYIYRWHFRRLLGWCGSTGRSCSHSNLPLRGRVCHRASTSGWFLRNAIRHQSLFLRAPLYIYCSVLRG